MGVGSEESGRAFRNGKMQIVFKEIFVKNREVGVQSVFHGLNEGV